MKDAQKSPLRRIPSVDRLLESEPLSALGDIPRLVLSLHVDRLIIAMPSAGGKIIRELVELCGQAGVEALTLPGIYQLLSGEVDVQRLRKCVTDRGKIIPRRISATCSRHQRQLSVAIKHARYMALLPYVAD